MSVVTGAIGAQLGSLAAGTFGLTAATWTQIGWTAGVLVGTYLFSPGQDIVQEGPRLDDLKVTSSAYGSPIPKVFGEYRIAGNIIWALPINETRHEEIEEEGKGGGGSSETNIWYTYDATWAVGLCEGPITGIKKIWLDSQLIYNHSEDGDFTDFSQSGTFGDQIEVYNGDQIQTPNWNIQSDKADTPAYRNLAYIVFSNLQLKEYGNRIPNVTCEVSRDASLVSKILNEGTYLTVVDSDTVNTLFIGSTMYTFVGQWDTSTNLTKDFDVYASSLGKYTPTITNNTAIDKDSINWILFDNDTISLPDTTATYTPVNLFSKTLAYVVYYDESFYNKRHFFIHNEEGKLTYNYLTPDPSDPGGDPYYPSGYGYYMDTGELTHNINAFVFGNSLFIVQYHTNPRILYTGGEVLLHQGRPLLDLIPTSSLTDMYDAWVGSNEIYILNNNSPEVPSIDIYDKTGYFKSTINISPEIQFQFSTTVSNDFTQLYSEADGSLYIIDGSSTTTDGVVLHHINTNTGDYKYIGTEENTKKDSGSYAIINGIYHNYSANNNNYQITAFDVLGPNNQKVEGALQELALESGLLTTDIDFTAGTDILDGYVVTKNMTARTAMEPLLSTYEYAIVETNHQLLLRDLQQSSSETIPEDMLGANSDNNIEFNIAQDIDLLKSITIRYANNKSDYQTSVQSSRRIDSNATEEKTVELALALTDDQAKQLAEKNLFKNWLMRQRFSFHLPFDYKDIIAGDVITITFNGYTKDVRVTKITITEDNYLICTAIAEDYSVYESVAIAQSTGGNVALISDPTGDTLLYILDIPTLRNIYNDQEGLYLAASSFSDSWSGCTVRSRLQGSTDFTADITLVGKTPLGKALTLLDSASPYVWDRTNSVTVTSTVALEDATESNVLNGANYILLGEEVLQYVNALDNLDGTYTLSTLLRGRFGTEHAISTHTLNELFVKFDGNTMGFLPKSIGNTYDFVATSLGENLTYTGTETEDIVGYEDKNYKSKFPFSVNVTPRPDDLYTEATSIGESKVGVYAKETSVGPGGSLKMSYIIPPGVDQFYLANFSVNSWNCAGSSLCYYDHSFDDLSKAEDYDINSSTGYTTYFVYTAAGATLQEFPTIQQQIGFFIMKNDSTSTWTNISQTIRMRISNVDLYNAWLNGEQQQTVIPNTNIIQKYNSGINLKPFSPYYFRGERSGNNINLEWMRRSRYISGYMKTLPIIEASEKYTLEIYDNTDTIIRVVNDITTSTYSYNITLDSLTTADEVRFKVYQVSNIVGEGYSSDYLIVKGV